MKRFVALATVALVALASLSATAVPESTTTPKSTPSHDPVPARCTIAPFRAFSGAVWRLEAWERGRPPAKVLAALRRRLSCAPSGHRRAMHRTWRRDKAAFYVKRRAMLWREEFKPFVYPDGTRWAVPYPITWCESGGNYFVGPSGAYGLIPPFPQWLPPRRQDEIAHRLYVEQGEGPWAPYESGCAYR
jgi:hypothetical protein